MTFWDALRAAFGLILTLGLVGLAAYAARRWGPPGLLQTKPASERRMAVIETLTLEPDDAPGAGEGRRRRAAGARWAKAAVLPRLGDAPPCVSLLKLVLDLPAAEWRRALWLSLAATLAAMAWPTFALAQQAAAATGATQSALNINLGTGGGLTDRVVQLVGLLTVLSLAPVDRDHDHLASCGSSWCCSLLRTALGLQQSPPNSVIDLAWPCS